MRKSILKAYINGKLTKREFLNYVDTHFPGIIIKHNGKFKTPEDKKLHDLAEKIDFDLLTINICSL